MISEKSQTFKYVDRGARGALALIPGWASDYRIFNSLNLKFNYLFPVDFSPFTFKRDLSDAIRKYGIKKLTLFGWSLGGFIAQEFASEYKDLVDGLILVAIRRKYKKEEIEEARKRLIKGKDRYLSEFYFSSFSERKNLRRFRKGLFKSYCEKFKLDYLLDTLDYLGRLGIDPGLLSGVKNITIIHGEDDRIAPIQESIEIKNSLPEAKFVPVKGAGHMVFLEEDLGKYI